MWYEPRLRALRTSSACLLLLGLAMAPVLPVAFEPDHYLGHGTAAEERVALHAHDGDHHHETARLELAESTWHLHCVTCARLSNSEALVVEKAGPSVRLAATSASRHDAAFAGRHLEHGPQQPRAPPQV